MQENLCLIPSTCNIPLGQRQSCTASDISLWFNGLGNTRDLQPRTKNHLFFIQLKFTPPMHSTLCISFVWVLACEEYLCNVMYTCAGFLLVETLEGLHVLFTRQAAWKYFIPWGPLTQDTNFSHTIDMYTKDNFYSCYLNRRLTFWRVAGLGTCIPSLQIM